MQGNCALYPPDKNGNIHPAILFAAQLAGVSKIFKAGGVQAIAVWHMEPRVFLKSTKSLALEINM